MKCEEAQALVEEYFDDELDERSALEMSAHIESCASCSVAVNQLALEHQTYQSYDREIEVSPALWMRVKERLDHESTPQTVEVPSGWQVSFGRLLSLRFSMATAAALVLSAVIITVVVLKYLNQPETATQGSQVASMTEKSQSSETEARKLGEIVVNRSGENLVVKKPTEARPAGEATRRSAPTTRHEPFAVMTRLRQSISQPATPGTPEQLVYEAEKKYLRAISLLTRGAKQRPSRLDSETRTKLDGALAAIDRTISSTRRAVRRNPNDPLAVQYMLTAYGKKVEVLKEMSNY